MEKNKSEQKTFFHEGMAWLETVFSKHKVYR
jgi:hypothetical protein